MAVQKAGHAKAPVFPSKRTDFVVMCPARLYFKGLKALGNSVNERDCYKVSYNCSMTY